MTTEGPLRVVRLAAGDAFGWPGAAARLGARPWRILGAALFLRRVQRELAQLAPSRVVAHWAIPCGYPGAIGGAHRLELVSHGADVRLLAALPPVARIRLVGRLAARAHEWRFVSESLLDQLLAIVPMHAQATVRAIATVGASPIDVPAVHASSPVWPQRGGAARDEGRARLVAVGRLVRSKRVDAVLRYVAEHRPEADLVVVGDGPERRRLERLAETLSVRARFLGQTPRSETLSWMADADELVFASRVEGLSTVLREAEALGLPVTRVP